MKIMLHKGRRSSSSSSSCLPLLSAMDIMIMLFYFFFLLSFLSRIQSEPILLTVTPKTLSKSGDSVHVQWSGIDVPSKLDWIGLYSPPDSAYEDFIGIMFLSQFPTWESGSGSFSLPLVALRSNYTFRIFHYADFEPSPETFHDQNHNLPLPSTEHFLAESETVGFDSGRGPEQIHLASTGREGEMRVMFVADEPEEKHVRYGEKEGNWERDVTVARAVTY